MWRVMPAWLALVVGSLAYPAATIAVDGAATAPSGPARPLRVLPAEAAPRLEAALAAAAPDFRLQDATIDKDHVVATVCDGAGCYAVRLEDAAAGCGAAAAGAFCVRFGASAPTDAAPLLRALAAAPKDGFWQTIEARPAQPTQLPPAEAPRRRAATEDLLPDPPATPTPTQAPSVVSADAGPAATAGGPGGAPNGSPTANPAGDVRAVAGRWLMLSLLVAGVALWAISRQRKGD